MIRKHFAFTREPFADRIEADEMFEHRAHAEAGARIRHLLDLRGIGLMTGEVGCGKTTACRHVIPTLHSGLCRVGCVALTTGSVLDICNMIARAFGLEVRRSRAAACSAIRAGISRLAREARQTPVLVVDEARHLRPGILEELRLLTNHDMDSEGRLCLLPVGLGEIRKRLAMAMCESLAQRLVVRCHLGGLERDEVEPCLKHRLRLAGAADVPVFTPNVVEELAQNAIPAPVTGNLHSGRFRLEVCIRLRKAQTDALPGVQVEDFGHRKLRGNILKTITRLTLAGAALALYSGTAIAGCGISGGNINVLANDFPALHAVVSTAEECAGDGVTFAKNHTAQHREIQVAALTADPAEYTSVIVANSSIVPLLNDGLIRPLDDLVAEHGSHLGKNQMITIDGKVMAIAFMANAQHLVVRQDILDQVGLDAPKTYEEVLAAAEAIRAAGIMEYPFAMLTKSDWNLGEEFVNMYIGHGGEFFVEGTAEPSVKNEAGLATLNMMKALMEYSNPDFLTYNTSAVAPIWEAGNLAMAEMWASSMGQLIDEEGSTPEVSENTQPVGAPTVAGGSTPSSTLWWDGFTIAKNISDEDAEASFIAMVNGVSDDMVMANNDLAVWLSNAYVPGKAAEGVAVVASMGAEPYPMLPYMGLLHQAFFEELPDFLQGNRSAEQTLADIEASYITKAKETGFLQ